MLRPRPAGARRRGRRRHREGAGRARPGRGARPPRRNGGARRDPRHEPRHPGSTPTMSSTRSCASSARSGSTSTRTAPRLDLLARGTRSPSSRTRPWGWAAPRTCSRPWPVRAGTRARCTAWSRREVESGVGRGAPGGLRVSSRTCSRIRARCSRRDGWSRRGTRRRRPASGSSGPVAVGSALRTRGAGCPGSRRTPPSRPRRPDRGRGERGRSWSA